MISVCIATYNGEKYIEEQISSILMQIGENDEIVISDDGSKDNTLGIIEKFSDKRILVVKNNSKKGVNHNFEKNKRDRERERLKKKDDEKEKNYYER